MFLAKIRVTLRPSILDPQGKAVEHALGMLGYRQTKDVRMGKYIELKIESDSQSEAEQLTEQICKKLLANPVMEDYTFSVESVGGTVGSSR